MEPERGSGRHGLPVAAARPRAAQEYAGDAAGVAELARSMPGYVEHKVFLAEDGERVTLVTFADEASHRAWRDHPEHRAAQRRGIDRYYDAYSIQVGTTTYASAFTRGPSTRDRVPEGDTVWLAAQRMHEALAGRVLTRSDFRVPQLATADLSGRTVLEVVPRGKHMLTRVEGGTTLHTHFRMDGTWHLYRPGDRWTGGADWQVRVVLANAEWEAVGYRLPVVELLPTAEEDRVVGHLGPDLLDDGFDEAEARAPAGRRPGARGRHGAARPAAARRAWATSTAARCCSCAG